MNNRRIITTLPNGTERYPTVAELRESITLLLEGVGGDELLLTPDALAFAWDCLADLTEIESERTIRPHFEGYSVAVFGDVGEQIYLEPEALRRRINRILTWKEAGMEDLEELLELQEAAHFFFIHDRFGLS